jgi:hypothetical protein
MKLVGRLTALEQRIPREVLGYQVTRVAPDGAVLHEIVLLVSGRPGMATRYFSVDGFYETYPAGQISKQLILEDDWPVSPTPPGRCWELSASGWTTAIGTSCWSARRRACDPAESVRAGYPLPLPSCILNRTRSTKDGSHGR